MLDFKKSTVAFLISLILLLSFSGCADTQSNEIEPQSSSQGEQSQNTETSSELTVSKMDDSAESSVNQSTEKNKDSSTEQINSDSNSSQVIAVSSSEPSSSTDQSDIGSSSSTSSFLDQHDFCIDELDQNYIKPVFYAGITYYSWDNAEQIPADNFSIFYLIKCLYETHSDTWVTMTVSAKDVETFIQGYFDVTTEHLRQADNFNKESQTYEFGNGIGAGSTFEITDVQKDDQSLTIFFNYITADKPRRKSELKVDISNGIRYLSCKSENIG